MILRNEDGITIETYNENEIKGLTAKGYVSIYRDKAPVTGKKKASAKKRSTGVKKGSRSTS